MRDGEMEKNMPLEYSGHLGARQGWSQEYKPLHKPAKKLYEIYQTLTAREREVPPD